MRWLRSIPSRRSRSPRRSSGCSATPRRRSGCVLRASSARLFHVGRNGRWNLGQLRTRVELKSLWVRSGVLGLHLMRICLVYDCLYPHTVGGAERWYRSLAERLVADGHEVTYLTLRQWARGADPASTGVDVRAVGPRMRLYTSPDGAGSCHRSSSASVCLPTWCATDGATTRSIPIRSRISRCWRRQRRPRGRYSVVVDWFEVWSREYWREYLGTVGRPDWLARQALCARVPQRAFCFSACMASACRRQGLRGELTVLVWRVRRPGAAAVEPRTRAAGRCSPDGYSGEAGCRRCRGRAGAGRCPS